ncbi:cytochrome P450 [Apiospora phragmitis]|uniref:Cytochrome P450 n=1 Tax=Apiospora phragmitis TaxID=2905665 RepID=A0ABR1TAY5_9PEZI
MAMEYSNAQLLWSSVVVLLVYYFINAVSNQKHAEYPLVGDKWRITPRFKVNFDFFRNGARMVQAGYQAYKSEAFQLLRNEGYIVILPPTLLEELSAVPSPVASPHGALERDLLGPYTGLNLILESRIHHSIVQRKLTPRLPLLTPALEEELRFAFQESFLAPQNGDWAEFQPYQIFGNISARLTARALVGPGFCRDQRWLDVATQFTEDCLSGPMRSGWFKQYSGANQRCSVQNRRGSTHTSAMGTTPRKDVLRPKINELLRGDQTSTPDGFDPETSNVLSWLAESAKGADRDSDTIAHIEVLLALASVHTTLLRMVNVLYDITASGDDLISELRGEIESAFDEDSGVLRESQRMSPPTTLGMKRLFKEEFTFSSGLRMPRGTYACMPVYAIENDPANTPNPDRFDGLRYYRAPQSTPPKRGEVSAAATARAAEDDRERLFTSPGKTALNFGYGKSACPGRFFASLIIKMLFVKLLTEYEFRFLPGHGRPSNLLAHEFLFCWPWQKMLVRRRQQ